MSLIDLNQTEAIVRFSRRQLWIVLGVMLAFAASYLIQLFYPGHANEMVVLYIVCVVAFAGSSSRLRRDKLDTREAISILENDELRRLAHARAFRNGFFVQLIYPAVSAFVLLGLGMVDPWPLIIGSSVWLGLVTFLASVLWYDR